MSNQVASPIEISVELSYDKLPSQDKKAVKLTSKMKKKNKGNTKIKNKQSKNKNKNKNKKKRRKKKSNLEVTSLTEEVLEDPEDLDQEYLKLKELVLKRFINEEKPIYEFSQSQKLEEKIEEIIDSGCDTFYLVDITTVILKYKYFKQYLPRVQPFYAVKCNPDPYLISTLAECGAGIDVASMPEMKKALDANFDKNNIIFANPCKMPLHISFAQENGVSRMTFDNIAELEKVKKYFPEANLVLRILADDSHSTMRFGSKFGADVNKEVKPLLTRAYQLDLNVIGVSFHVGSGCQSGVAYKNSLQLAKSVFDIAEEMGHPMNFLDIGGGFLGTDTETVKFSEVASSIATSLDELFDPSVRVIAEPGRYFASECVVLVTTVIARRERSYEDPETNELSNIVDYYISDGVYGSFNNMFFDYFQPTPVVLPKKQHSTPKTVEDDNNNDLNDEKEELQESDTKKKATPNTERSTLFGPTCDSIDVVCKDIELPELEIGDFVYFFNMGAYTSAAASSFNGFNPPKPYYMIS